MGTYHVEASLVLIVALSCATSHHAVIPEGECVRIEYHDFAIGTVTTYCEPRAGTFAIYEHTYTNGFAIFNPDGDSHVDRYCDVHRCVERKDLRSYPLAERITETLFFTSWDHVLQALPQTILLDRKGMRVQGVSLWSPCQ